MTTRQRTRLDPELRREQILSAASAIVRTDGFEAMSLDAVAERAGVTRGLLHHYFGSKRGLYLAVVERAVRIPEWARLFPEDATGEFDDELVAACVEGWMHMIEVAGGIWPGAAGGTGFADDVDEVLVAGRDALVERMITDVPFPASLDRDLLRSALRAYAALARVATDEWLVDGTLTREQAAAFLRSALTAVVRSFVPAMTEAS